MMYKNLTVLKDFVLSNSLSRKTKHYTFMTLNCSAKDSPSGCTPPTRHMYLGGRHRNQSGPTNQM